MTEKEIHEGILEISIACFDPTDNCYLCSEPVGNNFLEEFPDLKLGDTVQYRVDKKTGDISILGKVIIEKTVLPVKN